VTSQWPNKLTRISQMDWDEVRTRVGQELHKRSDLVLHRIGMRPATIRLDPSVAQSGQFFFSAGQVAERAELLRRHLPDEASEIVRGG
jgi:hypothetical protein